MDLSNHETIYKTNYEKYPHYHKVLPEQGVRASREYLSTIVRRRSIRHFNKESVDPEIIENAVRAAVSAPSGANKQPWFFVAISCPVVKKKIREAAEEEEEKFYQRRAGKRWLSDLKPFGTTPKKPFLEDASHLIICFSKTKDFNDAGEVIPVYYPAESAGIATGFLISALHVSGLATLTHTPSPMRFLNRILSLESHFKAIVVVATGYPKEPVRVPEIEKKPFEDVSRFIL